MCLTENKITTLALTNNLLCYMINEGYAISDHCLWRKLIRRGVFFYAKYVAV